MSIMSPQSPSQPKPLLRTRLVAEWNHFREMSNAHFLLLILPSILLLCIDPLIPIVAYLLQVWATSWDWRDRWASLLAAAKKSGIALAALAMYVLLDHTQVWLIPTITSSAQVFWRMHLPGTLSLSPLDGLDLLARSLLLLPLAPIVAVYYERIDPRTNNILHRVLTAKDVKPPSPPRQKKPRSAPTASVPLPDTSAPTNTTPPKKTTPPKAQKPLSASSTHQRTIESFLAGDPKENTMPGPSSPTEPSKTETTPAPSVPQEPKKKPEIDYRRVKE